MKKDLAKFMIHQARHPERIGINTEDLVDLTIKQYKDCISSPFIITDHSTLEFIYASKNIKNLVGYSDQDIIKDKIIASHEVVHPDDTQRLFFLFEDLFEIYFSIPLEDRLKYIFTHSLRIKKRDGKFIWLLHEFVFLKHDHEGKPLISLSRVNDMTSMKGDDTIGLYIGKYDDQCNYSIQFSKRYPQLKDVIQLSRREIEILKMISDGYLSKQIADKLHISFHTVNTHRQHMLEKTHTTTSSEMVSYACEHGII